MIDRENTIRNLETNIMWIEDMECHQFPGWGNVTMAMRDALELLKEQEAVKPTYEDYFGNRVARCGKCNGYIVRYKYCPGCGQAVKWNE